MRKMKISLVMVLALVVLSACAGFDRNAYNSLSVAKTTYTQAISAMGDLHKQEKITDATARKIIEVGKVYYVAYLATQAAYDTYHNNPSVSNKDQLIALLEFAAVKLADLLPLLAPYNVTKPVLTVVK